MFIYFEISLLNFLLHCFSGFIFLEYFFLSIISSILSDSTARIIFVVRLYISIDHQRDVFSYSKNSTRFFPSIIFFQENSFVHLTALLSIFLYLHFPVILIAF